MTNPAGKPHAQTRRMVVLLSEKERRQLEKLASSEKVSAGEVVRRSFGTYHSLEERIRRERKAEVVRTTLVMLAGGLAQVNESAAKTIARVDELHLELKKRGVS